MPDQIIDMGDMNVIFSVTDVLGIHRESVRVELSKEDPGSISKGAPGIIEITIPESGTVEEFSLRVRSELESMGYTPQELSQVLSEDEEEDWP